MSNTKSPKIFELQGKNYLTREGLAEYLAVSPTTVDMLRKRGALPAPAKTHRQRPLLFSLEDVKALVAHTERGEHDGH